MFNNLRLTDNTATDWQWAPTWPPASPPQFIGPEHHTHWHIYNDSALTSRIAELEKRVAELEAKLKEAAKCD